MGIQHGNVRYSPEAKQLYPAARTNSLDDDLLGPDPFLGGIERWATMISLTLMTVL